MVSKNKYKHSVLCNNNVGVGEDKISNLPNALTHHILSLLPIKCAMSACILSKRWKCVVSSIPILDFRNWRSIVETRKERKLETKRFMNFVDTILFLHEKPNIQKLCLELDELFDESRVNRWISTITKRKVKEFGLSLKRLSASYIFPQSFFTCDSLTLLDLDFRSTTGGKFNIPNTISFPRLKILRLTGLSFGNETLTRFYSNCPILEELSLTDCNISGGLCIVKPALKHLYVTSCTLSESVVEISAPNLLTISYTRYPPADFVLSSFPSLVEADVGFYVYDGYKYPNKAIFKLFEKLSSAKLLKIYANSFLFLREVDILITDLAAFNNLIHLEIGSPFGYTSFGTNSISTVRTFFRFLQLSPNLESVLFPQSICIPDEVDDGCWSVDPICSPPLLKSIKFKEVDGKPGELNAIKFF